MNALIWIATSIHTVWICALALAHIGHSCWVLGMGKPARLFSLAAGRVHQELWLFAPPGGLLAVHERIADERWVNAALVLLGCWLWWRDRDWPDDNIWKKRGRKLRDKVRVLAGRLVVSPA